MINFMPSLVAFVAAYVPENFKAMMDVAKGGFYMWANTGSSEGWVHTSSVRDITTGELGGG